MRNSTNSFEYTLNTIKMYTQIATYLIHGLEEVEKNDINISALIEILNVMQNVE